MINCLNTKEWTSFVDEFVVFIFQVLYLIEHISEKVESLHLTFIFYVITHHFKIFEN